MSENESNEELEKKGKTITVKHEFEIKGDKTKKAMKGLEQLDSLDSADDLTKEQLKEKLAEREAVIATASLMEFERDKKKLLASVPPENREGVSNWIGTEPERLESIRGQMLTSGKIKPEYDWNENPEDIEQTPPKGRVSGLPRTLSGRDTNAIQIMEGLYEILEDSSKTPREKEEATNRINNLYKKLMMGRKQARISGKADYGIQFTQCPNCHKMIVQPRDQDDVTSCPHCGWHQEVKRREL